MHTEGPRLYEISDENAPDDIIAQKWVFQHGNFPAYTSAFSTLLEEAIPSVEECLNFRFVNS